MLCTHVLLLVSFIELNENTVVVFETSKIPAEKPKHPPVLLCSVIELFICIVLFVVLELFM